jgi:hypothetical protein
MKRQSNWIYIIHPSQPASMPRKREYAIITQSQMTNVMSLIFRSDKHTHTQAFVVYCGLTLRTFRKRKSRQLQQLRA